MTPEERAIGVLDDIRFEEARDVRAAVVAAAIREAVLEEREACAKLADKIVLCYFEHTDECQCTGEVRVGPSDVGRMIRARGAEDGD